MIPTFITFTGADDSVDVADMVVLARDYPVEYGISLHPEKTNALRFPGLDFQRRILSEPELFLSAHLCGDYAKWINQGEDPDFGISLSGYKRAQINLEMGSIPDVPTLSNWGVRRGLTIIAQTKDSETFPDAQGVEWLYDVSEGSGVTPDAWPKAKPGIMVGFAGRIGPSNVAAILKSLPPHAPFWIDMASGVRNAEGQFDLGLCRKVCQAVYGAPNQRG